MTNRFFSNHKLFKSWPTLIPVASRITRAWLVVSLKLKVKKEKFTLDEPKTYPAGGFFYMPTLTPEFTLKRTPLYFQSL